MTAAAPVKIRELADPQLLASVEDLDLVARWVVEGFLHGLHRSPYVGFSVDFASHREYIPGDDTRHLNWKVYGRQDRLYIKQYDAETNVDLHLVLDISGSMTVGEGAFSKLRYAILLAASLAQGDLDVRFWKRALETLGLPANARPGQVAPRDYVRLFTVAQKCAASPGDSFETPQWSGA